MATALANMRKSVEHVVSAFLAGRSARAEHTPRGVRYFTDGHVVEQWGNVVARKVEGGVQITDAGWRSSTTKQLLNSILDMMGANWRIYQEKFEWNLWNYVTREKRPWNGTAIIRKEGGSVEGNRRGKHHRCNSNRCCPNTGDELVLQSAKWIYAPGFLKWVQTGYATSRGKQKKMFSTIISGTWKGVPQKIGLALAAGKYPYTVKGEDIVIRVKGASGQNYSPNKSRFNRNMMSVDDARFLIGQSRRIIRDPKLRTSLFLLGKAAGMTYAAGATGPPRTSARAARIGRAVAKYAKVIPNPIKRFMKNLHTAGERLAAKKLIRRYYRIASRAILFGKKVRAAHAYGALAAIRRLAQIERPVATDVVHHATVYMEWLRAEAKGKVPGYEHGSRRGVKLIGV
jgi:hypothetical protein